MKVSVKFSVNPFQWLKYIYLDIADLFSASGRKSIVKENQDMHFLYSMIISVIGLAIGSFIPALQFHYIGGWIIFFGGFALFCINGFREGYLQNKAGIYVVEDVRYNVVPFEWKDLRFGMYGGIVGSAMVYGLICIEVI